MTDLSIALCAIVRNEIRGVVEWLAHYKALGFTDIVIYDNESTDGTEKVLQALDEAGELIRIEWPHSMGAEPQRMAYQHMLKHSTVDWIAFFDADEFLFLRRDDSIGAFLGRFGDDVSAIAVNWVAFNSGGQEHYRPAPVIERFTECLPPSAHYSRSMKGIGRRVELTGVRFHSLLLAKGRYVTPSGKDAVFRSTKQTLRPDVKVAALHHYMVKSLEEFQEKRLRGHANSQDPDAKRRRLDEKFDKANAPGVPNTDLLAWSGRMRAEAMRLRAILLEAGLHYPVWPFIEAD